MWENVEIELERLGVVDRNVIRLPIRRLGAADRDTLELLIPDVEAVEHLRFVGGVLDPDGDDELIAFAHLKRRIDLDHDILRRLDDRIDPSDSADAAEAQHACNAAANEKHCV